MKNNNSFQIKKPIYDLFLDCSYKDYSFAELLYEELSELGISVFYSPNSIKFGDSFGESISSAISSAKYFIPIITENSIKSKSFMFELGFALARSKNIIPICFSFDDLPITLLHIQAIKADSPSKEESNRIARIIADIIYSVKSEDNDFELLSNYIKSGANNSATEILCKLIVENCNNALNTKSNDYRKEKISKLFPLLDKLHDIYDFDYSKEARELAHRKREVLSAINKLFSFNEFKSNDLFYISSAIRLIYFDREIRWDSIDTTTGGDLSDHIIQVPSVSEEEYEKKQHDYVLRFESELVIQSKEKYTDNDWQFILETPKYIYKKGKFYKTKEKKETSKLFDDELLIQVASFMREGNKVFDLISENQQAEEFFRCLILSYERLKQYCEFVGEQKVCAECIERIFELNQKINNGFVSTKFATKAQDGIKTLLGLTIPKSGNFDVFISHKSEDTDIASDMYNYLKQNMKEAFYDKETLPEMSESQYRKSIMRALDGSTHFVLILSDLSYLDSYWVNLEMEIFQSEIDEGRKPNSNFIIVVTQNVYDEIISSNKSAIPIEYRRCEIMKVDEYKTKLLSYLNKKTWG